MTVTQVSRSPAGFVDYLTQPGLKTARGAVALNQYVSGAQRSPRAARAKALLTDILTRFTDSALDATPSASAGRRPARFRTPASMGGAGGSAAAHARALNELEIVRDRVVNHSAGVRPSNWRRLFTGQGMPENLLLLWEYIISHREFLCSLESEQIHSGSTRPFEYYFSLGHPVRAMVADEIFGYDCLGFVGNYLHWAGLRSGYPEWTQAQYITRSGMLPLSAAAEIRPLTVLLWLTTATQHIAIVDKVHRIDGNTATVDICQSSAGGPQVNCRADLRLSRGNRIAGPGGPIQVFRATSRGSPAMPVAGDFALVSHPDWLLVRPGT